MKHKVVILGGGSGGISVAARLSKTIGASSIAIVEPSEKHFYQPAWTLVGGGLYDIEDTTQPEANFIPKGTHWIKESVEEVVPSKNQVKLRSGGTVEYEYLVVATGLRLEWEKIKGLQGNLGKNGLVSIYEYEQAPKVYEALKEFKGGTAIFVMPPVPIKCAGAPQKIMYLADEIFRENGVRDKSKVIFTTAGKVIFGVPAFAATLNEIVKRKNIEMRLLRKLVEVDAAKKIAKFEVTIETPKSDGTVGITKEIEETPYDLLHVVPSMMAHEYVTRSGLAFTEGPQTGWLKVDQGSLQHKDFPNIFGVGDVTGVPNSKTGAAIRKQAPIVVQNLLDVMHASKPTKVYDGYSSCPLVTSKSSVVLAEFGYDGKLMPTFPFDQTKERYSMYFLKRYILPRLYWQGMLRGRA